jgi:hypothetical protein
MTSFARKSIITLSVGAAMVVGVAPPASADVRQDGLVNVAVNLEDVNVNVPVTAVVQVVAQLCDAVDVGPVAAGVLGQAIAVDNSGRDRTVCTSNGAPVTIRQNIEN